MNTNQETGIPAPKDRADELSDKLRLVRDALSLDLGDGVDVVDGARACREERDRLRQELAQRMPEIFAGDVVDLDGFNIRPVFGKSVRALQGNDGVRAIFRAIWRRSDHA
jgi:hypothetical protein